MKVRVPSRQNGQLTSSIHIYTIHVYSNPVVFGGLFYKHLNKWVVPHEHENVQSEVSLHSARKLFM